MKTDKELREDYTVAFAAQNEAYSRQRADLLKKHEDSVWAIFEPVLKRIKELTPSSLQDKVSEYFNFDRTENENQFNLFLWMKDEVFFYRAPSRFKESSFSKDEIEALNEAWKDFIALNFNQKIIRVVSSDFSKQEKAQTLQNLRRIVKEVSEENKKSLVG